MNRRVALIALALATTVACSGSTGGQLIIKRPNDGETFTTATTVVVSVEVLAPPEDASIERIEFVDLFFSGTVPRCTDASTPYTCSWPIDLTENGVHTWTAKAHLSSGQVWSSPAITVHVGITDSPDGEEPPGGQFGAARGVTVSGAEAYVTSALFGLTTLDVRDPSEPSIYASSATQFSAKAAAVRGTLAVVLGESGDKAHFWLLDTTRGQKPPILGQLATEAETGAASANLGNVEIDPSGLRAIAALGEAGVYVINLSEPSNPTIEGSYDTAGFAHRVSYDSDAMLAYVADGAGDLVIVDVAAPGDPVLVHQEAVEGTLIDVEVTDDVAYLLTEEGFLTTLGVATPTAPVSLDSINADGTGVYVSVWDQVAVLVLRGAGDRLKTYNVSDPEALTLRGESDATMTVHEIDVANARAYLASGAEGVRIFNVQWPNPRLEGSIVPE